MLTIESTKATVSESSQNIFDFLSNLNNLEKLMPSDRVEKWSSSENSCRFGIKNLGTIGMKVDSTTPPNQIVLVSDGKNPFPFKLTIFINEDGTNAQSHFVFDGEVNMFMQAMIKKPLKSFFDSLANKLPEAIK